MKNKFVPVLALVCLLSAPVSGQQAPDARAVYQAVLAHVSETDASEASGILLSERVFRAIADVDTPADGPTHSMELLTSLVTTGYVEVLCNNDIADRVCEGARGHTLVSLGRVREIAETASAARSHSLPDVHLEILVTAPCPAAKESPRCRVPDAVSYQYLLRRECDGFYRVLSRRMTGAI
jgi:hypothetical protein